MGDAIRNVFSCTLLVIFSLSLFIWGFLVNRRRAWRLDGGTAVFGSGALGLAIVTTASSFVAVKEEGIDWLQHLIWAAVLWQTWLGWWWWVGAGMGIGEVEDIMERTMRKRRKAARRAHSRHVINAANEPEEEEDTPRRPQTMAGAIKTRTSAVVGFTSSLAHLRTSAAGSAPGSGAGSAAAPDGSVGGGSLSRMRMRRRSQRSQSRRDVEEGILDDDEDDGEAIELGVVRVAEPAQGPDSVTENGSGSGASNVRHPQSSNSNSDTSSTSRTPSLHAPRSVAEFVAFPATWLQVYIRRLRKAHEEATRRRAVEQAERRARVPTMAASADDGWGLGSFGIREHQESTWRLQEADRQLRADMLIPEEEREGRAQERDGDITEEEGEEGGPAPMRPRHSSARGSARTSRRNSLAQTRSLRERERLRESQSHAPPATTTPPAQRPSPPAAAAGEDGEWEDILSSTDDDAPPRPRSHKSGRSNRSHGSRGSAHTPPAELPPAGSSWSWWGPLREWRLRDRSTY